MLFPHLSLLSLLKKFLFDALHNGDVYRDAHDDNCHVTDHALEDEDEDIQLCTYLGNYVLRFGVGFCLRICQWGPRSPNGSTASPKLLNKVQKQQLLRLGRPFDSRHKWRFDKISRWSAKISCQINPDGDNISDSLRAIL